MKKILVLCLTSMLIATLFLTGCTNKNKTTDGKNNNVSQNVKAGFIYIGEIGEAGYTYAHEQGRKKLVEELGIETVYRENIAEGPEVEEVIKEMIEKDNVNVIFGTSYGYMDYMEKMAKKYPDIKFLHCSGLKLSDNMGNYFGKIEEARYLTGIAAGLKTKTNKIGYVAAYEIPEVVRGINAFTQGVKSVNPEAKIYVKWTNTWFDLEVEKQAATSLIDMGADIIAQHQDSLEPQMAAKEKGKFSIGYHSDMSQLVPDTVLASAVWNWGPYYIQTVKSIMDGTWKSEAYLGDMKDGIVDITPLSKDVPEQAKNKIKDMSTKFRNREFNIFSGPIYNNQGVLKIEEGKSMSDSEMISMDWFVDGVEVVK